MANLRSAKRQLKQILLAADWRDHLDGIVAGGKANVGALFSFLLLEPEIMHRAAVALGLTIAKIHEDDPEAARNIIRRFMWHMNEESGNIGWGIPDAFAEALAASPGLAATYARILISYIIDLGFDDNYCDNDILRRDCYWAIGRLAQARPELAEGARPWLVKGLKDRDLICRGMAAWALGQLPYSLMDAPALKALASAGYNGQCAIFDGEKMRQYGVSEVAAMAAAKR